MIIFSHVFNCSCILLNLPWTSVSTTLRFSRGMYYHEQKKQALPPKFAFSLRKLQKVLTTSAKLSHTNRIKKRKCLVKTMTHPLSLASSPGLCIEVCSKEGTLAVFLWNSPSPRQTMNSATWCTWLRSSGWYKTPGLAYIVNLADQFSTICSSRSSSQYWENSASFQLSAWNEDQVVDSGLAKKETRSSMFRPIDTIWHNTRQR